MALVSEAQLNALRKYAYRGLDTPFTVWRKTRVENDYGMSEGPPAQVSSGVCWLRMMNTPRLREMVGHQEGSVNIYRMHTTLDVDIDVEDEIHVFGHIHYVVQDVNDDDTIQVFRTAIVRRAD